MWVTRGEHPKIGPHRLVGLIRRFIESNRPRIHLISRPDKKTRVPRGRNGDGAAHTYDIIDWLEFTQRAKRLPSFGHHTADS